MATPTLATWALRARGRGESPAYRGEASARRESPASRIDASASTTDLTESIQNAVSGAICSALKPVLASLQVAGTGPGPSQSQINISDDEDDFLPNQTQFRKKRYWARWLCTASLAWLSHLMKLIL